MKLKRILLTIGILGLMVGSCISQVIPENTTVEIIKRGAFKPYNELADDVNEIWNKTNRNFILLDTTIQSLDDRIVVLETSGIGISDHTLLSNIGTLSHDELETRDGELSDSIKTNVADITTLEIRDGELSDSVKTNITAVALKLPIGDTAAMLSTYATNITTVTSTSTTNTNDINTLNTSTAGVFDWMIQEVSGDTVSMTYGNNLYKFLAVASVVEDVTAPTVNNAEIGTVEDSIIYISMSESVNSPVVSTAWDLVEGGVSVGVDTMDFMSDTIIRVYLDSSVANGSDLLLSYTRPGGNNIQDAAGNFLLNFSNHAVINNVATQSVPPIAAWHFENSAVDSSGNGYTLTTVGSPGYSSTQKKEGSYGGSVDAYNAYFTSSAINLGYVNTISLWYTAFSVVGTRTLFSTLDGNDGLQIDYDPSASQIIVTTGNGTTTTEATSSTGLTWSDGTFAHIVVVSGVGSCKIYWNNVDVTSTGTMRTDYDNNAPVRLGIDFNGDGDALGYIDAVFLYNGAADEDDIDDLYTNPGTRINIDNSGDPPIPDTDITTYWTNDWADYALQTTLPQDTLFEHMPNYISSNSANPADDTYHFVDIVDFAGERWAKSKYPQGQYATEVQHATGQVPGCIGTGMDGKAWITDANTVYTELYLSYDMYLDADVGDFENSAGFKQPGLEPWWVNGYGSGRIMILNSSSASNDLSPAYYTSAYYNGYDYDRALQTNTKTGDWFESGKKINITLRMVFGSEGGSDGMVELFVDGIFIGGSGDDPWPGDGRYNIPWYPTGSDRGGWGNVIVSTFMGGGTTAYASPKDQFQLLGLMKVWDYDSSVTDVPRWDDASPRSGPGRDITGALRSLGYDL